MAATISVAMLPAEAKLIEADCFVVVDTLRATTTIATLFSRQVRELWVADEISLAHELATQHDAVLLGEVGGLPPDGFAFGNSPVEIASAEFERGRAVLFTTNGTRALCEVAPRGVTFAGALVNASAIAEAARTFEHVAVVCAGESRGRRFALEDFAAAAAIVQRLVAGQTPPTLSDAALLASEATAERQQDWIVHAKHADDTRRLGLHADIEFACQADVMTCVPQVTAFGEGWALLDDRARPA